MRIFLNILTVLFSTLTIFFVLSLYLGSQNGAITLESPARTGLQIYGGLSALLALGFGFWTGAKESATQGHVSRTVKFAALIGLLCLGALIGLSFLN